MTRNRYSSQEENTIVEVQFHSPNLSRRERATVASVLHPNNTHSLASWAAMFGGLEAHDSLHPLATEFVISQSLLNAATSAHPQRFS